ncbi:uncharacterized protein DUF4307 [Herbihabitans rhizosphaerae]|uniref:Uncharacterized protein DUF4307 n=1 Tax=Herbihabitans rhizosphaerae TaxID=1872711 RepID=A0A4Q7KXP1_9PSEU|nr:DUF4307 domain-containing protein [Herbihabitans rhizosphaerae]RZS40771.1 uncharacterized protein DUF4307 [Herbihabitans rhizosphaerae]
MTNTIGGIRVPEGRYGSRDRPRSRRWKLVAWVSGALVVGGVVTFLGYTNLGTAPIETQRTGFSSVDPTTMRLNFDVVRDEPGKAAVCIVRVRSVDGAETGRKEVLIPPGGRSTSVSTVIKGTREPVTADVFGCSYQVPGYLSTDHRPTE